MFPVGQGRLDALGQSGHDDRELWTVFKSGMPRGGQRLWRTHAWIFQAGEGAQPELPAGWEQRVDRKSGRIFFVNHNQRTTGWADPRSVEHGPFLEEGCSTDDSETEDLAAELAALSHEPDTRDQSGSSAEVQTHGASADQRDQEETEEQDGEEDVEGLCEANRVADGGKGGEEYGDSMGGEDERFGASEQDEKEMAAGGAHTPGVSEQQAAQPSSCTVPAAGDAADSVADANPSSRSSGMEMDAAEAEPHGGEGESHDPSAPKDSQADPAHAEEITCEEGASDTGSASSAGSETLAPLASNGPDAVATEVRIAARADGARPAAHRLELVPRAPVTSELQLLRAGTVQPTAPRLARRAALQLAALRRVVQKHLPEAASQGESRRVRGLLLLHQRRCRLLQELHLALMRSRRKSAQPSRSWAALYSEHEEAQHHKRCSNGLLKALDSLSRHSEPDMRSSYTSWFKSRSHLARCNTVLHQLPPLNMWGRAVPDAFELALKTLQHKLLTLAEGPPPTATPVPPRTPLSSPGASPGAADPSSSSTDALRAMMRLALVKGELSDYLLCLQALMAAAAFGGSSKPTTGDNVTILPRSHDPTRTFLLVQSLLDLETACERALAQSGLAVSPSSSLGFVATHPTLGVRPPSEFPNRAALLSTGAMEASSAAAVLTATLAQASVGTVWGVGPWEHDLQSLLSDPPPDEIASAVAHMADRASYDSPDTPPKLQLHVPLCLDVAPECLRRLFSVCADALVSALALSQLESAKECGLLYTCLGLLRLLKVHLHYVVVCRVSLTDLGLDIHAPAGDDAEHPAVADAAAPLSPANSHGQIDSSTAGTTSEGGEAVSSSACMPGSLGDPGQDQAPSPDAIRAVQSPTLPVSAPLPASPLSAATPVTPVDYESATTTDPVAPGPGAALVLLVRQLLLRLACGGLSWVDPATGNPIGDQATAEAIALLQVGRRVFFPSAEERCKLLLSLLSVPFGDSEPARPVAVDVGPSTVSTTASFPIIGQRAPLSAADDDIASLQVERRPTPQLVLVEVLLTSFAQNPNASDLVVGDDGQSGTAEGISLLQYLVRSCAQHGCHRASSAQALCANLFWDLLSRASLCTTEDEPVVEGLISCAELILEHAACQHPITRLGQDERIPEPLTKLLPWLCTGLTLFASFGASVAHRLLPTLVALLRRLCDLTPPEVSDELSEHAEQSEDFDLGEQSNIIESAHPYQTSCAAEHMIRAPGPSSCLWLLFDERSCTVEGEASLEVWADGQLLHTFSGPHSSWPKHPLVIPGSAATLRFHVSTGATTKAADAAWGYACVVCGFDPSVATPLPLLMDCQKSVANLAAKYAATLLVGEPLSPEERAYIEALETMQPRLNTSEDEVWQARGVPSSLMPGLLEKRQRRASSRALGLEAMLQLVRAIRLESVRKHVLLHLANALTALQTADSVHHKHKKHSSSHFTQGCRGCDAALEQRVHGGFVQLFASLAAALQREVAMHLPSARAESCNCRESAYFAATAHIFSQRFCEPRGRIERALSIRDGPG